MSEHWNSLADFMDDHKRGESASSIAEGLGFHRNTIGLWLKGKKKPTREHLLRFCNYKRADPEIAFELAEYRLEPTKKEAFIPRQSLTYDKLLMDLMLVRKLKLGSDMELAIKKARQLEDIVKWKLGRKAWQDEKATELDYYYLVAGAKLKLSPNSIRKRSK